MRPDQERVSDLAKTLEQLKDEAEECGCNACDRISILTEAVQELLRLGSFPPALELVVTTKLSVALRPTP